MFYKNGKVISTGKKYILFESADTGYLIYVPNVSTFKKDEQLRLYIYEHKTEFDKTIYGFKDFKGRVLFEDLLGISGIGPKSAINLLSLGYMSLISLIAKGDIQGITQAPYIGQRSASMIVLELRDKYKSFDDKTNAKVLPQEIAKTLKTLGFAQHQIDFALKNVKPNESVEILVEDAIKVIANAKEFKTAKL